MRSDSVERARTGLRLELARGRAQKMKSAFAEIVRRLQPQGFPVSQAGSFEMRSHVEEAAQEIFLKAFTQLKSFEGRGSMEGWLRASPRTLV